MLVRTLLIFLFHFVVSSQYALVTLYLNVPFDLLSGIRAGVSCHPDVFCFADFAVTLIQEENVISGALNRVAMPVVPQGTMGSTCPSIILGWCFVYPHRWLESGRESRRLFILYLFWLYSEFLNYVRVTYSQN